MTKDEKIKELQNKIKYLEKYIQDMNEKFEILIQQIEK